jgi:hypothetical protein
MFPTKADSQFFRERMQVPAWVKKLDKMRSISRIDSVVNAHAGIKISNEHINVMHLLRLWQNNRRNEGVSDSYTDFCRYMAGNNDPTNIWRNRWAKRILRKIDKLAKV